MIYCLIASSLNLDALDAAIETKSTNFNVNHIPDEDLINESGKIKFLVPLLDELKMKGHRTLVFSMSRRVLDIIEKIMRNKVICLIFVLSMHYSRVS